MRSFDALNMKPILPSRIGGTRWLPHLQRAMNAFTKGFKAIIMQLENSSHDNPKAEGLAKLAEWWSCGFYSSVINGIVEDSFLSIGSSEFSTGDIVQDTRHIEKVNMKTKADVSVAMERHLYIRELPPLTGNVRKHRVTRKRINSSEKKYNLLRWEKEKMPF